MRIGEGYEKKAVMGLVLCHGPLFCPPEIGQWRPRRAFAVHDSKPDCARGHYEDSWARLFQSYCFNLRRIDANVPKCLSAFVSVMAIVEDSPYYRRPCSINPRKDSRLRCQRRKSRHPE